MNKTIIYDLFGGGCNSLKKALSDNDNYEIYTFDILDTFKETFKVDLTREDIIDKMLSFKLPKPDIIVASPPCMSFSRAAAMKYKETIGNATWYYKEGILREREREHYKGKRYKYESQMEKARIGRLCIENTLKIIQYFKPKYFYIENPAMSLLWEYKKLNLNINKGFYNKTIYGAYGTIYKKPTIFYSNIKLDLKQTSDKKFKSFEYASKQGIDRSYVPPKLLKEIIEQFKEKQNE